MTKVGDVKDKDSKYYAEKFRELINEAEANNVYLSGFYEYGYFKIFIGEEPVFMLSNIGVKTIDRIIERNRIEKWLLNKL